MEFRQKLFTFLNTVLLLLLIIYVWSFYNNYNNDNIFFNELKNIFLVLALLSNNLLSIKNKILISSTNRENNLFINKNLIIVLLIISTIFIGIAVSKFLEIGFYQSLRAIFWQISCLILGFFSIVILLKLHLFLKK